MKSPIRQAVVARTLAVLAVLTGSACSESTVEDKPLPIETIDVSPSGALNLSIGSSAQLSATPKGGHGEPLTARAVSWQSGSTAIATVSPSGQVTAIAAGTAQITATSESKTSPPVSVVVTAQSRIALSRTTVSFDGVAGFANPAAQTVSITNGGTGILSGVTVGAIQYTVGQPGWLTASLTPSTAPSTLTLQAATGALSAGTYTAIVPIASTTAANSPTNVTVTFVVTASFGLTISGAGTGNGTITGSTISGDTFTCTITSGVASGACAARVASGVSLTLTPTPSGTSVFTGWGGACTGTSACTLTMSADRAVTATFNAPTQTVIALTTSTVSFIAGQGGANPAVQTVGISNGGAFPLTGLAVSAVQYTPGQPTSWLSLLLSSTVAPANLNLQPNVGVLAPGNYTATVNVTSPVASNSPRTVTITLAVVAKPVVVTFAPTNITFNSASLNGSVAQDGQPYQIYFEYGTNSALPSPVSTTSLSPGPRIDCPGAVTCTWSPTLTGLISKATYYYRIVAINAAGTSKGSIIMFKTN